MLLRNGKSYNIHNRSSIKPHYDVSIDFDGASKAWMLNKIKNGNGTYVYKSYINFIDWLNSMFK